MQRQQATRKNSAAGLVHPVPWIVVQVTALESFCFQVRFRDNLTGIVEMHDYIHSPRAGVFAALRDEAEFRQIGLEHGAVTWANGLDLAPDNMYRQITAGGGIYHMNC